MRLINSRREVLITLLRLEFHSGQIKRQSRTLYILILANGLAAGTGTILPSVAQQRFSELIERLHSDPTNIRDLISMKGSRYGGFLAGFVAAK